MWPVFHSPTSGRLKQVRLYKIPSMFKLVQLFKTESYIPMFNLGKFNFNSMKLRSSYTNTWQYILCGMSIYVRKRSPENSPLS